MGNGEVNMQEMDGSRPVVICEPLDTLYMPLENAFSIQVFSPARLQTLLFSHIFQNKYRNSCRKHSSFFHQHIFCSNCVSKSDLLNLYFLQTVNIVFTIFFKHSLTITKLIVVFNKFEMILFFF